MIIKLDNKDIDFFEVSNTGKIINSGDNRPRDWNEVYLDLNKVSLGMNLYVSFNKREMEKINKEAVYTYLNYKVLSIEN